MPGRVVVVGDALIDYQYYVDEFPKAGQDVTINENCKHIGGSAANSATALAQLGIQTFLSAFVGDDEDGCLFLERLKKSGVDTSLIKSKGKTGFTVSMIDSSGGRTMLSCRGVSAQKMPMTAELEQAIANADVLLMSGYYLLSNAEVMIDAAKYAKKSGTLTALDPCPVIGRIGIDVIEQMMRYIDVLLPNEDELEKLTGMFGKLDISCLAVKLGSRGSKLFYQGQEFYQPAWKVNAVDTTGAGDAFNAGFISAMLSEEDPQQWLKKGNEMAAGVVGKRGAV